MKRQIETANIILKNRGYQATARQGQGQCSDWAMVVCERAEKGQEINFHMRDAGFLPAFSQSGKNTLFFYKLA